MRYRGTLVLVLILAALLVYIYVAESPPDEGPGGGGEGRLVGKLLFPALAAGNAEVGGLRWANAVGTVSLTRSDGGRWTVEVAGRNVPCAGIEVDELLTLARQCRVIRLIPGDKIDAGRLGDFRLEPPSTSLSIMVGGVTHSVGLGAMSVARDLVYARRAGETDVLLVDSSLVEALGATTSADLRLRRAIDWGVNDLRRVEVRAPEGVRFSASRANLVEAWRASAPFSDFIDTPGGGSRFLAAFVTLDIDRFVKDGVAEEELGAYGLVSPRFTLSLTRAEEGGRSEVRTIRIGDDVPDSPGHAYVMEDGFPFVLSCRIDGILDWLGSDLGKLRDRYVTRLGEVQSRVRVRYPPAEEFELLLDGGRWRLDKPERQQLEPRDVGGWLQLMRMLLVTEFIDEPDLVALGLADPRGEIRVWAPGESGEVLELELRIGNLTPEGEGVYVQRAGEKYACVTDSGLVRVLRAGHFALKRRVAFGHDWNKLEPLGIAQRTAATEASHTFDGEKWSEGTEVEAVEAVRLCLMRLAALRWTGRAAAREAEFGLAPAAAEIRMSFRDVTARDGGVREFGVLVGSRADGGYFARAIRDGGAGADVFVLTEADYRILTRTVSKPR